MENETTIRDGDDTSNDVISRDIFPKRRFSCGVSCPKSIRVAYDTQYEKFKNLCRKINREGVIKNGRN